ncbi:MAG: hypothetical protein H6970_02055 [Gammaproteobacteria bacterium]|nr:hypothetical protein [Gammaproteobacteria bacterium]MCP5423844.1 hypothetical protein [Gammaproteobacteria bacterium]
MRIWQELVTIALVGTAQQPPQWETPRGPLGDTLQRLVPDEPATHLLTAAGIVALWRQVARAPDAGAPAGVERCPADVQTRCGPLAGQHLALMLAGHHSDVLPEWLVAVAESGRRVAEPYLPGLLEAGRARTGLQDPIRRVLGERGRWLARQNQDWHYAIEITGDTVWQTGDREQRRRLLAHLRHRQPEQARTLLLSTWQHESAKDRVAFLQLLAERLSLKDEPFLEQVLDDRSKEVHRTAADLLARLPESRLVQRLRVQAESLLTFQQGHLLRKDALTLQPPTAIDATLLRDGVDDKNPHVYKNLGERAWLCAQIIAAVPPSLWCSAWDKNPAELLEAARKNEWRQALWVGWTLAALRHTDSAWVEALLAELPDDWPNGGELVAALPTPRREAHVRRWLSRASLTSDRLLQALRAEPAWSIPLTRAVLDSLRTHMASAKSADWRLRAVLDSLVRAAPPELADEATTGWPTQSPHWPPWNNIVQESLAVLNFRRDMLRAIQAD